ncbi:MAG TPA: response regulator [Ktedonobacteraceae bacterium]|nr:response regulator [Ktedonobacteraceae bacterium]
MNLWESGGMMIPEVEQKRRVYDAENAVGQRLRVLIWGAGNRQDHFEQILAANIQQWGYNVVNSSGFARGQAQGNEDKADVLVGDLDSTSRFSTGSNGLRSSPAESAWPAAFDAWCSQARLLIALSSSSIPRAALERLGAVALLHKPFEMSQLQRYLRVLQRVLVDRRPEGAQSYSDGHQGTGHEQSVRILVVDDHKEVANTIRACLEFETHYEVKVANEGLEALEQCMDWQPDCIVTDLLMPWMNGYQVMRSLSAGASIYAPSFVVMSALPQHELPVSRNVPKEKEIVYLDKPFQVNQLLQAVEVALAQK